jgi:hypothetical protein
VHPAWHRHAADEQAAAREHEVVDAVEKITTAAGGFGGTLPNNDEYDGDNDDDDGDGDGDGDYMMEII